MKEKPSRKKGFLFAIGCATITVITDPGELSVWGHPIILYLVLIIIGDIITIYKRYKYEIKELEKRVTELEE